MSKAAIDAARHMGIEHPNCSGCCALSEELITWQKDYDSMCQMLAEPLAEPELLEALKMFMDSGWERLGTSKRAQQRRVEMWDKASAAIAKAEGRS